jgi:hypothetical protein
MKKNLTLVILIISCATQALLCDRSIHEAVRTLDFAAVEDYFAHGGNPNSIEKAIGQTPLDIAIKQAFPKTFELKNYPFDKQTFMVIKKLLRCSIAYAAHKAEQLIATLNNTSAEPECSHIKSHETAQLPACITQEELDVFINHIKRDAPNCITSVVDILTAANECLFESILFYDVHDETPQIKMVKVLISHKATTSPSFYASLENMRETMFLVTNELLQQSSVRTAGDAGLILGELFAGVIINSYIPSRLVRLPLYTVLFLTGIKTLIDVRNTVSGLAHQMIFEQTYKRINDALSKR